SGLPLVQRASRLLSGNRDGCRDIRRQGRPRYYLALHFAFAERFSAGQHPAEDRIVLSRRSLRVSETEQVAVRPAIALLVLHRLVCQAVGLAADIPAPNGIAQTAAPTAHGVHVFGEVEQVRADAADLAEVLEGERPGFRIAVSCYQSQSK